MTSAKWLRSRYAAILGSDAAQDVRPSGIEEIAQPIHLLVLVAMGMPIFDNLDLSVSAVRYSQGERVGVRDETGMASWLIDERSPLDAESLDELDRELVDLAPGLRGGGSSTPMLAVDIHDLVIHDNRKWFGEASVRLDALVVTGTGDGADPKSFYIPKTATFDRVKDRDRLPIGNGGLLIFHGPALHFVDMMLMVSRERQDVGDLSKLLADGFRRNELQGAAGALMGLSAAAPQVAAATAAMSAAAAIGEFGYRALRTATGTTIGLYRNAHLQFRDGFGIGSHPPPPEKTYRVKDLSFRYEIIEEGNAGWLRGPLRPASFWRRSRGRRSHTWGIVATRRWRTRGRHAFCGGG